MSYSPATAERSTANQVLARYWSGRTLPVDPFEIARQVGLSLLTTFDASGWYKPNQGVIYYNPSEPYVRQRFTVAHELGHHFLNHGERPRDGVAQFNMYNFDPVEAQANRFAAELLMPAATVEFFARSNATNSVAYMAKQFYVSEVAMTNRLKNLGYL